MDSHPNIIRDSAGLRDLLAATRTIAVLGIKTEAQSGQPAFYVPSYLAQAGFDVIPVPVYYPDVKEILGRPVYRKLVDIPQDIDLVSRKNRRPSGFNSAYKMTQSRRRWPRRE
jgi:predicted CoA-binding protein